MVGRANHPWVDETHAPLYIVSPPDCSDADLDLLFRSCEQVYTSLAHDVAWVFDTTVMQQGVSAKGRRIVAEHLQRNAPVMKTYVAGVAVITPSALMRGVYTAVTWLVPLEFPRQIVQTRQEGVHWAQQALVERHRLRTAESVLTETQSKP